LQRVFGRRLECRNISRNISTSDLQKDQCLRRQCPSTGETNAIHPEASSSTSSGASTRADASADAPSAASPTTSNASASSSARGERPEAGVVVDD
jgi:hypothetical protein